MLVAMVLVMVVVEAVVPEVLVHGTPTKGGNGGIGVASPFLWIPSIYGIMTIHHR